MAEYIEREKAQDGLDNIEWYHVNDKGQLLPGGKSDIETYVPFKAVEDMLKAIPAADVRPVVICRDCDCWNDWDSAGKESLGNYVCSCAHWSVEDGPVLYTRPTDFCSYGEKKEKS